MLNMVSRLAKVLKVLNVVIWVDLDVVQASDGLKCNQSHNSSLNISVINSIPENITPPFLILYSIVE